MNTYKNIANFIFEAAVTKRLKRTGWQILGDNEESVGEHSYMTAVIAYVLGRQLHLPIEKVLLMSIFHDFHESRTGDLDKINKLYLTRNEQQANKDIFTAIDPKLLNVVNEYEEKQTIEAKVVYEANIIALLVELKRLEENGNIHAREWIVKNSSRLRLSESLKLTKSLLSTNTQNWWKQMRKTIHTGFKKE
ncbi:MAG: hypothetical protein C0412_20240 [Flavobacterium sp.]|nr:hypothetical protein [Flavobacterium sp.]